VAYNASSLLNLLWRWVFLSKILWLLPLPPLIILEAVSTHRHMVSLPPPAQSCLANPAAHSPALSIGGGNWSSENQRSSNGLRATSYTCRRRIQVRRLRRLALTRTSTCRTVPEISSQNCKDRSEKPSIHGATTSESRILGLRH